MVCRKAERSEEEGKDAPSLLFSRLEVRICGNDRDSSGELAVGGLKDVSSRSLSRLEALNTAEWLCIPCGIM